MEVANRGPETARLELIPTIWFRNTWSWGRSEQRPELRKACCWPDAAQAGREVLGIELRHHSLGRRWLAWEEACELLFTENETNTRRLYGLPCGYAKDGIHDYIVQNDCAALNPEQRGTKAAARYSANLAPGESRVFRLRLLHSETKSELFGRAFDSVFQQRKREADEFFATVIPNVLSLDARNVTRQAFAGLLWSKQFYHYVVRDWLGGDPGCTAPPPERLSGRNRQWRHLYNADVLSVPDKWEYPWYAAWDLAFHCVALALVDAEFAKEQLILLLREWYMHPNGQLPAYEWALSDVNPPVHAWAAWRVYKIDKKRRGKGDRAFLARILQKLLLNFTWWVNRKDSHGRNVFQGGFLGLDNIGVFDRSAPLPTGGQIEQADGTGWMGMYCLNMLAIAMELAQDDPTYEDVASKFWEHFLYIAHAINHLDRDGASMWDGQDGFFYDVLSTPDGGHQAMKVRSMVGLIPLFAVQTLEPQLCNQLAGFKRRLEWFIENRADLTSNVASMSTPGQGERRLLSIVSPDQLRRVLTLMLDEQEFLSPFGVRSVSRKHHDAPYVVAFNGDEHRVDYQPAESITSLFGGNSNWRGPIWLPVNFLLIESLQKFHHYFGDAYTVECPTGSGQMLTLWEVAAELSRRLARIFLRDQDGCRRVHGNDPLYRDDPHWRDLVLFYEYFHGDNGVGLGASHQTGWTALIAKLLQQSGE
jgi:hypothetical protein